MIQVGTEWLMAERVKAADAPAYAERRRASVVYGPGNDGVIGRRMVGKQPLPVGREAVVPEAMPAQLGVAFGPGRRCSGLDTKK